VRAIDIAIEEVGTSVPANWERKTNSADCDEDKRQLAGLEMTEQPWPDQQQQKYDRDRG
jgi:hypothetical protein